MSQNPSEMPDQPKSPAEVDPANPSESLSNPSTAASDNAASAEPTAPVGESGSSGPEAPYGYAPQQIYSDPSAAGQPAAYGQQTWWLYTCLTATRTIDLNKAGCELPKPAARH